MYQWAILASLESVRTMTDVLCIIAHPDDETRLCGGIIAHLTEQGIKIQLLCLTRGEGGELGEPPLVNRAGLGRMREDELRCAATKLGIDAVTFMDYVDPPVSADNTTSAPRHKPDELTEQIAEQIRLHSPTTVLTHGSNGEYGHPAHLLLHHLTRRAIESIVSNPPPLYSFAATFQGHGYPRLTNQDDPAHMIVNVKSVLGKVVEAAHCHRTQHALFVRRQTKRTNRQVTVSEIVRCAPFEGVHRHMPTVDGKPKDHFARWMKK